MAGAGWTESTESGSIVRHEGPTDLPALAQRVSAWLGEKGFETQYLPSDGRGLVVRANEPRSWKTAIGASPSVEVRLAVAAQGTYVDIRLGKAGGVTWAARYFTYSWVALGLSFTSLKRDLEHFLKTYLQSVDSPSEDLALSEVVETYRSERGLGSEDRLVDNLGNGSPVTRTLKVRKRWLQTCRMDVEQTTTGGVSVESNALDILTLSAKAERMVRRQYAISTDVEQEFEEQIELEIPAYKSLIISLNWKRIIQHGEVRLLRATGGNLTVIPYEVDVGVTFDQRQSET
jgi:hypothetical protein